MIYVDTSVALAQLFNELRHPPTEFWFEPLTSSRILEYEVWNRVHVRQLAAPDRNKVHDLLSGITYVELAPQILARALEPFPIPVRTLDGLHLATLDFMHSHGQTVELASYDGRLLAAAQSLGISIRLV